VASSQAYRTIFYAGGAEFEAEINDTSRPSGLYSGGARIFQADGVNLRWYSAAGGNNHTWRSIWWIRLAGKEFGYANGRRLEYSAAPTAHTIGTAYRVGSYDASIQFFKGDFEHVALYPVVPSMEIISKVADGMSPAEAWPNVTPFLYFSGDLTTRGEIPATGWAVSGTPQYAPGPERLWHPDFSAPLLHLPAAPAGGGTRIIGYGAGGMQLLTRGLVG